MTKLRPFVRRTLCFCLPHGGPCSNRCVGSWLSSGSPSIVASVQYHLRSYHMAPTTKSRKNTPKRLAQAALGLSKRTSRKMRHIRASALVRANILAPSLRAKSTLNGGTSHGRRSRRGSSRAWLSPKQSVLTGYPTPSHLSPTPTVLRVISCNIQGRVLREVLQLAPVGSCTKGRCSNVSGDPPQRGGRWLHTALLPVSHHYLTTPSYEARSKTPWRGCGDSRTQNPHSMYDR